MTAVRTWAVALSGIDGHLVEVEADLSNQRPDFRIIGLPDKSLGEATQRVHNACKNAGLELSARRLTVNLSPASLPKHGSIFDLGVAIAALGASGSVDPAAMARTVHIGELGLDGRLRPIPGVLPAVFAARKAGFENVIVPHANEAEARLVPDVDVRGAVSLAHVASWHGADVEVPDVAPVAVAGVAAVRTDAGELSEVIGQEDAVDALLTAAAGGHHILMSGPPGSGKTMLASRLPGILPALTAEEALEVASIRSLSGLPVDALDAMPPMEAPHHSASAMALVGGGSRTARPGAAVRAHRGLLFLDEAPEFSRVALDALRQPLESGVIDIQRAGFTARFPARFQLVLAMNPCPCGNYGVRGSDCTCPSLAIRRYAAKLSGPLRDRVDIDIQVARVPASRVTAGESTAPSSSTARGMVAAARDRAARRWAGTPWRVNADVPGTWLRQGEHRLPPDVRAPLDRALERGALTLRGYDRVLRIAWTVADLAGRAVPGPDELGRALFLKRGLSG